MATLTISQWKYCSSHSTINFGAWETWPGSGARYIHHNWENNTVNYSDYHYGYALKLSLTPASGQKITTLSLKQTFAYNGNQYSDATITAYLLSADPTTVVLPTSNIVATSTVTLQPRMSAASMTFTFSGLNITSATTYYVYFYSNGSSYACTCYRDGGSYSSLTGTEVANQFTNTINHWAWGFKNSEGNNGTAKTAYNLANTTWNAVVGSSVTLNSSNATNIPNGYSLRGTMGSSSISGTWTSYTLPYTTTQPSKAMSFEFDYDPNTYSITYTLNGGTNNSSNPSSYNVLYGVTFANPDPPGGYTFKNWTIGGTVVTGINPGANATFTSATDLYNKLSSRTTGAKTVVANYDPIPVPITLDANGGTGGTTSVTITYGTAKGSYPSITKPTWTGHIFNGFWSAKTGGTQWYDANGNSLRTFNLTSATTLYAQWTLQTFPVTYNKGDATSGTVPSNQTKSYGTNLTLQTNSGSLAHSQTTATKTYANQAITLVYNANGGTNAPASTTGGGVTVTGTCPVTWSAIGWGTSSGTTTKTYDFGGTYTANSAATLYPAWSKTEGSVTKTAISASAIITQNVPTKANYVFLGWSTSSTATTPTYYPGGEYSENITASKNVTLYAVWQPASEYQWVMAIPYVWDGTDWRPYTS